MTADKPDAQTAPENRAKALWANVDVHRRLGVTALALNTCATCGQPCVTSASEYADFYVCAYCGHASDEPAEYDEYKFTVECSHCRFNADSAIFYSYPHAVMALNNHSNLRECKYSTTIKDVS